MSPNVPGVSFTRILCTAFLQAMQKAHQSSGREERCLLSCRELQGRDEGAAQDSLVNGTNFHKLQCINLIMCGHMNRALNTGRIPILRITLPHPLICSSAVSNLLRFFFGLFIFCSAASSVIPRCHSLPTSSISRLSAQDLFRRNVAQWNCTSFWLGS